MYSFFSALMILFLMFFSIDRKEYASGRTQKPKDQDLQKKSVKIPVSQTAEILTV
jgi:hypothetical protein